MNRVRVLAAIGCLFAVASCSESHGGSSVPTAPTSTMLSLGGTVRDASNDAALSNVAVTVLDGPNAKRYAATDAGGNYGVPALRLAGFTVRFSKFGYVSADRGVNLTSDTRIDVLLEREAPPCTLPGIPVGFMSSVSGSTINFSWSSGSGAASDYLLEIGSSSQTADVDIKTIAGMTYSWTSVPNGRYFVRIKARNSCGTSGASGELSPTVPSVGSGGETGSGGTGGVIGGGGSSLPSAWSVPLPSRSGSPPLCQPTLPAVASCVNDIIGQPQAICDDARYSCSMGSGTCSNHGGVYCWRRH